VVLTDRPGALGAVASRIGSVRGDVIAVEIVERQQGLAIDEFVVELPDEDNVPLLVSEIEEVDGVSVEEIHPLLDSRDRRLDAYEGAAALLRQREPDSALQALASLARRELDASWAAVIDAEEASIVSSDGRSPEASWLGTYVAESRAMEALGQCSDDIAHVTLVAWDLILVVGRPGWRMGQRERARLDALARLADATVRTLRADERSGVVT